MAGCGCPSATEVCCQDIVEISSVPDCVTVEADGQDCLVVSECAVDVIEVGYVGGGGGGGGCCLTAATPTTSVPGNAATVGSAADAARADHRHGREPFGVPVGPAPFGSGPVPGSAVAVPRSDHVHGIPAITPTDVPGLDASKIVSGQFPMARLDPQVLTEAEGDARYAPIGGGGVTYGPVVGPPAFGASPVDGVALSVSRSDHVHGLPLIVAADVPALDASKITTGVLATGRIPDLDGSKITTGTVGLARLPAELLTETEGDARYEPIGGGGVTYGPVVGPPAFGTPAADGVLTSVSRSDHVHGLPVIVAADVPNLDAGKITTGAFAAARIPNLDAAKITTGVLATARIPDLDGAKITTGTVAIARLPAELLTQAEGDARYDPLGSAPAPAGTVVTEITAGQASAPGTATAYSRGDHTHGTPPLPTAAQVGALAVASNLSDLANAGTARTNLGLGTAAVANVGTGAGTVAAGNDARIVGAVQTSLVDAKGDLLAGTGPDALARLPVGTDGQILSANSAQATGLQWIAAPSGGGGSAEVFPLFEGYNLRAASASPSEFMGNTGFTNNEFSCARVWVPAGVVITNLWANVRTGGTHDGVTGPNQIGLWTDAGVQVGATADNPALWTAAGWRGGALAGGPVAAQGAGRFVYIGTLSRGMTGGTRPILMGADDNQSAWFDVPVGGGNRRGFYLNGQAALPASFNPVTAGTATAFFPLVGVN